MKPENQFHKTGRAKTKWKHYELKQAFTPVYRRVILQHMLRYLSAGVLAALVFCLLLSGLSFLQPIENILFLCLISGLTIVAAVLAAGRLRKPSVFEAARIADRLGLQEKIVTACELDYRKMKWQGCRERMPLTA